MRKADPPSSVESTYSPSFIMVRNDQDIVEEDEDVEFNAELDTERNTLDNEVHMEEEIDVRTTGSGMIDQQRRNESAEDDIYIPRTDNGNIPNYMTSVHVNHIDADSHVSGITYDDGSCSKNMSPGTVDKAVAGDKEDVTECTGTEDVGHHHTNVEIRSSWKRMQDTMGAVDLSGSVQGIRNVVDSLNVRRSIKETLNAEEESNVVNQSIIAAGFMNQSAAMTLFHVGATSNNTDTGNTDSNTPVEEKYDGEQQNQPRAQQGRSKRNIYIWLSVALFVVVIIIGVAVGASSSKSESTNSNSSRDNSSRGSGTSQSSSSNQDIVDACIFLRYYYNPGGLYNFTGSEIYFDLCRSSTSSTAYGYGNTIPTSIGLLTQLTSLVIVGSGENLKVKGTIPPTIGNLLRLKRLDMSGNKLSGTIPTSIERLTQLEYLSVSSNDLSGKIPAYIGYLSKLTQLYLNDNNLSGTIPPFISSLTSLTTLDVYINPYLKGLLPSSLCRSNTLRSRVDCYSISCANDATCYIYDDYCEC
jgi:Leucine-rich repeat (LRR) protein